VSPALKLHILSDLHTGHCPYGAAEVVGDVLVLAGDIGDNGNLGALEVARGYRERGLPVLYVPGNHEFYRTVLPQELRRLQRACKAAGITLLHKRTVVLGGVRFIGAILWTDFLLDGVSLQYHTMQATQRFMADFTLIQERAGDTLLPETTLKWHRQCLHYIQRKLSEPFAGKTVLVTHHAPHPLCVHEQYRGNPLNGAFVSDLSATLAQGVALAVHGHVHNSFDFEVEATRIVANPRGYVKRWQAADGSMGESAENEAFDPCKLVEI
jgi:Icc-related predicted phosphoesterase